MKRKKNLERAIILGLILSTSVYGSAWAEEIHDISNFRNLANPINITKDTIVNGTGTSIGGDEVNNTISGKVITVSDGVNFTLNNLAGNHMDIKGNGNIFINLDHDAGANGGAIYINGNITANKLTIDTSKTPNTKGIYTYGGDVVLDVNELDIKANSHGIFTTGDATSDVIINDTDKVSITTDGAHGIVNSGNASHVNNIIIKSDRENSLVDIFSHTAGISNNNSGGGVIDIKADTISIGTDNLYAVRGDHGDIILTAKNNIISGGTSGVHTLNGDIKITAEEGNKIATTNDEDVTLGAIYTSTDGDGNPGNGTIEIIAKNGNNEVNAVTDGVHTKGNGTVDLIANGYNSIISDKNAVYNNGTNTINIKAVASENESTSTLADYNDYNNILIAGENGVQSDSTGTTNVIADNDNTIVGATNGILSDGAGTIKVTAGNDNIIGQYTDENNVTHTSTSNTGINVTEGAVNVTADGSNSIYGNLNGINVNGANSKVSLNSAANVITVNNSAGAKVNGINVDDDGFTEVKSTNGNIEINVETTGTLANAINVGDINGGGEVKLTTTNNGDVLINVVTGMPNATNGNVYGIQADKAGKVTIDSANNVVVKTESTVVDKLNGGNDVSAIEAHAAGVIDIDAKQILSVDTKDINSVNSGIRAYEASALVDIDTKGKNEYGYGVIVNSSGKQSHAVFAQDASTEITAEGGGIYISADGIETTDALYLTAINVDSHSILNANGDIVLTAYNDADNYVNTNYVAGVYTNSYNGYKSNAEISGHDIYIKAESENNASYGIYAINASSENGSNKVELYGHNIVINADGYQGISYGILSTNSEVNIVSNANNQISSTGYGVYAWDSYGSDSNITLETTGNNILYGYSSGVVSSGKNALIDIDAIKGTNMIASDGTAIQSNNSAKAYLTANKNNEISASTGVWTQSNGYLNLDAVNNIMDVDEFGIYTATNSKADLIANEANNIYAGNIIVAESERGNLYYGQQSAVYALSGSSVDLAAGEQNYLLGAVYANGSGTNVDVKGKDGSTATNVVRSAAVIANAGGLDGKNTVDNVTTGMDVVSALYAEKGAVINVSGINDFRTYYSDPSDEYTSERVVWAYDTADINIDGYTNISTTLYNKSPNSKDIAIAAGTATKLTADKVNAPVADRATVILNYDNFTTNDGKQAVSEITGDILSAYAGQVDIATDNSEAGININGNLLAGNNGILNVNLGKGGVLTGRADDYGDAGANSSGVGSGNDGHQSSEFFDPAFSSEIFKGGEVNLTMGENSRWNVTGQSWITRINTAENSNAIIDLVGSNTDRNTTAHALTVYEMNGDANFNMNLDADRDVSDMLYIKNANGNYVVNVIDAVTEEDMYADRTDGGTFDGLRFATVGKGSTASFRAITYDGGFNNVEYIIGSDSYDESTENHHYNGDSLDAEKPGDSTVDDFFKNNGTPGSTTGATNDLAKASLMALPVNETNNAENDDLTNVEVNTDETTNFKLIGVKNTEISDGGETILNMSRANYSNAIYMDRLNKRLGEARYINSEDDEGMWVRIRHDRIGKDDAYRSQNTMYELGYDQKQECDNGERRVGMAIDYMHGDTGYNDIAGKGEIDRYGLWLYDTWMGDKGHYADYVAKWGHLSNDFEIYNSRGEVTGDYSNNVFSVSAEYGRKKDIGNDWYFEPQVQAQLARVTGADYTTSQGTKVSVDGINSLIGRAGFRLGKDFGEEKQSTVYIKADVLHEFLGDQDIRALDSTTNGNWQTVSYENKGTWYDVGFGFATQLSKASYAFMDFEKSFGNDNDETYQINVGMQWSF